MAHKSPEQLAQEFEGRKAKGLAKGAAAYWPNVLANAVLKLVSTQGEIDRQALFDLLAQEADTKDVARSAGATEAIARLNQAIAKGS